MMLSSLPEKLIFIVLCTSGKVIKISTKSVSIRKLMVDWGLEPPTSGLLVRCSTKLAQRVGLVQLVERRTGNTET